jgi:hypothetical protein
MPKYKCTACGRIFADFLNIGDPAKIKCTCGMPHSKIMEIGLPPKVMRPAPAVVGRPTIPSPPPHLSHMGSKNMNPEPFEPVPPPPPPGPPSPLMPIMGAPLILPEKRGGMLSEFYTDDPTSRYLQKVYSLEKQGMVDGPVLIPSMTKHPYAVKMVNPKVARLWDYAIQNIFGRGSPALINSFKEEHKKLTLKEFAGKPIPDQIRIINKIYDAAILWKDYNQSATEMTDYGDYLSEAHFPSSFQDDFTNAFKRFGIGFRAEKVVDQDRILSQGFSPVYGNMMNFRRACPNKKDAHVIEETIMETTTKLGQKIAIFRKAQDVVSETATCISRNIRGATKFPEPELVGQVYVFAVKPSLKGYDTEKHQEDQDRSGHSKVWRFGEKGFPKIGVQDIIAYTLVEKRKGEGSDGTGDSILWYYQFMQKAWTWVRQCTKEEKTFLEEELSQAYDEGMKPVPKRFDFYHG